MLIESTEDLLVFINTAKRNGDNVLALDTEFFRDGDSYYPRLSLVQVCWGGSCCIIDVLSGLDLRPILDILSDDTFVKVFHDCQQDLVCLGRVMSKRPARIFDTQIAMMFCSTDAYKIGYAKLVKKFCDVDLDTKYQMKRSDWKMRPLSDCQIEYAYNDVLYLHEIYRYLNSELLTHGKLSWFNAEMNFVAEFGCNVLANATRKARNSCYGIEFVNLFEWREIVAKMSDVHRNVVLSDCDLRDLYLDLERSEYSDYLGTMMFYIDEEFVKNGVDQLDYVRNKNRDLRIGHLVNPRVYNDECMRDFVSHVINAFILSECKHHNISSRLVGSHIDVEDCFFSGDYCKIMKGWRYDVFGKYILKLLSNKFEFAVIASVFDDGDCEILCKINNV